MKNSATSAWTVLKKKLKERYQHLSDADLAQIAQPQNAKDWLDFVQRRAGVSPLEIARLMEEALPSRNHWPLSPTFWTRNSNWL